MPPNPGQPTSASPPPPPPIAPASGPLLAPPNADGALATMLLAPLPSQPRSIPVLNPGTVPIVKVDRRTAATEDPTVNMKGGHALRVLKRENEELFKVNADLQLQIEQLQVSRQKVLDENAALAVELKEKNNKIAVLRKLELHESRNMRSQEEVETLLVAETSRRIRLETEARELRRALERCKGTEKEYRLIVDEATTTRSQHEDTIATQQKEVVRMQKRVKDMEFEVDELRVNVIKSERRCEDLEKRMVSTTQKNDLLTQVETALREENTALQKRLRELIDANKEVTGNYQAIKKNHDLKRSEFEDLATELEEAKNACQLAIRQRKATQSELTVATKQRQEMAEKNKAMENLLARKEKDIADLLTKVNDTINDYEMKLERKEEQMWAMSLQLSEGADSQKNRNHIAIDPDFINDIEKKWQAKEKNLQAEIDRISSLLHEKEDKINALANQVSDLHKNQFQPRMERLKAIEKDIKSRMEEYALAEERMETGFLCPRDLQCFKVPMTLIPCGHTYCKGCIDSLQEENYNKIKCQVCNVPVEHVFRNEQLESVGEQFARRKTLTVSFLEWIKMLKVYLPAQ